MFSGLSAPQFSTQNTFMAILATNTPLVLSFGSFAKVLIFVALI